MKVLILFIGNKNFYEDVLNGKVKYFSNLIQKDDDLSK